MRRGRAARGQDAGRVPGQDPLGVHRGRGGHPGPGRGLGLLPERRRALPDQGLRRLQGGARPALPDRRRVAERERPEGGRGGRGPRHAPQPPRHRPPHAGEPGHHARARGRAAALRVVLGRERLRRRQLAQAPGGLLRGRLLGVQARVLWARLLPRPVAPALQADAVGLLGLRARLRDRPRLPRGGLQHAAPPLRVHGPRLRDGHPRALLRGPGGLRQALQPHLPHAPRDVRRRARDHLAGVPLRGVQVPRGPAAHDLRRGHRPPAGGRRGREPAGGLRRPVDGQREDPRGRRQEEVRHGLFYHGQVPALHPALLHHARPGHLQEGAGGRAAVQLLRHVHARPGDRVGRAARARPGAPAREPGAQGPGPGRAGPVQVPQVLPRGLRARGPAPRGLRLRPRARRLPLPGPRQHPQGLPLPQGPEAVRAVATGVT
mmetsp:Transcript_11069/g.33043  ORF Transcript_11069/g.33043 Transcript_11069/m.33043 type:complete len:433 (-) Transcript_11069:17-1315(-)